MADFKIGDRVLYKADSDEEKQGTIVSKHTGVHGDPLGSWWVQWDGHTQRLWADSSLLTLETLRNLKSKSPQVLNQTELKSSETTLRSWILKDSPCAEEIQGACKFLKFSEG